jgi:hypothetical protein
MMWPYNGAMFCITRSIVNLPALADSRSSSPWLTPSCHSTPRDVHVSSELTQRKCSRFTIFYSDFHIPTLCIMQKNIWGEKLDKNVMEKCCRRWLNLLVSTGPRSPSPASRRTKRQPYCHRRVVYRPMFLAMALPREGSWLHRLQFRQGLGNIYGGGEDVFRLTRPRAESFLR